jgi:uncharacterized protein
VANALSLLMPHLEPYVVRSVRSSFADLSVDPVNEAPDGLLDQARAYVRQEAQHHVEHRKFNDVLATRYRTTLLERWMGKTFAWFERRQNPHFGLAFAAGAETVAFTIAQWLDRRVDRVLDRDDPTAALFLWHLAEEAEHRSIAFDVMNAARVPRREYTKAMTVAFMTMVWFIFLGVLTIQWKDRRIFNPFSWARIIWWTLTFIFHAIPLMAVTTMRGNHPADLADPHNLLDWLDEYDRVNTTSSFVRTRSLPPRTIDPIQLVVDAGDHVPEEFVQVQPIRSNQTSIDPDHLGGAEVSNAFLRSDRETSMAS